ncbi:MAG TPA: Ig-like domain-containing protein, partial [Trebonia sp.]
MQNKRKWGVALSVAAIAVAATGAAVGLSGPAGAAVATGQVTAAGSTGPGGTWGPAQPVPGLAGLAPSGGSVLSASIKSINCAAPGNCAAVGSYVATKGGINSLGVFVVNETGGTWGNAQKVTGAILTGVSHPSLDDVSCGAPGDCTATGSYASAADQVDVFLVTEASGTWGTATAIDESDLGTGADIQSAALSCSAAGECAAAGTYTVTGGTDQAFVMDEQSGAWGKAEPVAGQASLQPPADQSGLLSVSCAAPGDCTAAGFYNYDNSDGGQAAPLLVTEVNHNWGNAKPVPDFGVADPDAPYDGELDWISCREATACTALGTGTYGVSTGPNALQVFTVDEADGSWGNAHGLTIPGSFFSLSGISCSSAGNCAIAGSALPSSSVNPEIYTATESGDGNWSAGTFISGIPAGDGSNPTGVSCAPGGDCTVAGYYFASSSSGGPSADQELTATGVPGGSFGAAHPLSFPVEYGEPVAAGPDCAQAGYCVLAASSPGTVADLPVLDSEATAATVTLRAARPSVTFGAEQAERLTATVTSPAGGTPAGSVTVTDGTSPACTITLANGTGSCTLTARAIPAGSDTLTATYSGDVTYVPAIGTSTVTVARASTVTRLAFTPRSITFNGKASKLTVTGSVSSTSG